MPAYSFKCHNCNILDRFILSPPKAKEPIFCSKCGCLMVRVARPPTTQVTETLDNGLMARALERPAEAETIYNERAHGKKGVI
jgi:hypothetical protein